eukprot:TRINITY_DN41911_c0_g1_i1.p1 TRINITY_DN41911_c0_g1~~TRINITY_DN41911_c0_g1_i1.p1  ORF type:complete len:400 (+),score=87.92 TRINITY_DN41911_c0_g1_i1:82-1281(+)
MARLVDNGRSRRAGRCLLVGQRLRISVRSATLAALYATGHQPLVGAEVDSAAYCHEWALQGECERNPEYMLEACATSCAAVAGASPASSSSSPPAGVEAMAAEHSGAQEAAAAQSAPLPDASATASEAMTRRQRCEASRERVDHEAWLDEQQLWAQAQAAASSEKNATQRIRECERTSRSTLYQVETNCTSSLDAMVKDLTDKHKRELVKNHKETLKREFRLNEAHRAAQRHEDEAASRIRGLTSGADLQAATRRAQHLEAEAGVAEEERKMAETAHFRQVERTQQVLGGLQQRLQAALDLEQRLRRLVADMPGDVAGTADTSVEGAGGNESSVAEEDDAGPTLTWRILDDPAPAESETVLPAISTRGAEENDTVHTIEQVGSPADGVEPFEASAPVSS